MPTQGSLILRTTTYLLLGSLALAAFASSAPAHGEPPARPPDPLAHGHFDAPTSWLHQVAGARQLTFLQPVRSAQLTTASWQAELAAELERALPHHRRHGMASLLVDLQLLPSPADLMRASRQLSEHSLAAFYSPAASVYYVAPSVRSEQLTPTNLHELAHALQDQHFALGARADARAWPTDSLAAVHCLAEGDAVLTAALADAGDPDWVTGLEDAMFRRHPDLPAVVVRSVVSPYVDGTRFVQRLYAAGGWPAVDVAWRRTSLSTEQVLHPDKYASDEGWRRLEPWQPPGESCTHLLSDVLGEQALRDLFRAWSDPERAAQAAAGWDGDRLDVFVCDGVTRWRLRVAFDTPHDLEQALALTSAAPLDARGAPEQGHLTLSGPRSSATNTERP